MLKVINILSVLFIANMLFFSCSGKRPSNIGVSDAGIAPCQSSPNCVSSNAHDNTHQVAPLQIAVTPAEAWQAVRKIISETPRTRIARETADYLHAECRSTMFGFVDDLELHLRPTEGIIAVRSASRLGYSDFSVNRRRIERLRASLIIQGVLR